MATQREMYHGNELYAWRENAANRTRAIDVDKWAQNQADILHLPGAQGEKKLSILDNVISPSSAFVQVDTEGGAPADDLASITPGDLHSGMLLHLVAADSERVVTLRNSADATGIQTVDGKDVDLDTQYSIVLRLVSTDALTYWQEIPGPLRAKNQPATSKDSLGLMQVGPHLEVTPEGVVDAPVASESKQGIGRSATTAEMESGVTGKNGPAWVTPEEFKAELLAKIDPVVAKALGIFNTRLVLTSSHEAWTPPVTGWCKITCIGGGGAAGGGGVSTQCGIGGAQGGSTAFGNLCTAEGGSGGGGGGYVASGGYAGATGGGGGGGAGKVVTVYAYLSKDTPQRVVIGAGGGAGSQNNGTGPEGGICPTRSYIGGSGAGGASSGGTGTDSSGNSGVGGSGGSNGTGYGGGGGGGTANSAAGIGVDGGKNGAVSNLTTNGGNGGPGAIIIEYFDPDKEAA